MAHVACSVAGLVCVVEVDIVSSRVLEAALRRVREQDSLARRTVQRWMRGVRGIQALKRVGVQTQIPRPSGAHLDELEEGGVHSCVCVCVCMSTGYRSGRGGEIVSLCASVVLFFLRENL